MSFVQNRFTALLDDENTEVDKLGNAKPKEKKENESDKAPTRREVRRNGQRQPAVSPPSRRDRGNLREQTDASVETTTTTITTNDVTRNERGRGGDRGFGGSSRGRQFDRHSGTGIRDNEKKFKQGWGEAGTAEFQGARDSLNSNGLDASEGRRNKFGGVVTEEEEEEEDNTKTLSEYLAERKNQSAQQLPEARKANDGNNDQWKGTVTLEKKDDLYFAGKNHEQKSKSKAKKEKVFLEIDQPSHQRSQRGGRNNNNRHYSSRDNQGSVNLSDSNAFPNLSSQ